MDVMPPMYGCRGSGIATVPSSRWKFSRIARIMRGTAHAVAFRVCTKTASTLAGLAGLPFACSSAATLGLHRQAEAFRHVAQRGDLLQAFAAALACTKSWQSRLSTSHPDSGHASTNADETADALPRHLSLETQTRNRCPGTQTIGNALVADVQAPALVVGAIGGTADLSKARQPRHPGLDVVLPVCWGSQVTRRHVLHGLHTVSIIRDPHLLMSRFCMVRRTLTC